MQFSKKDISENNSSGWAEFRKDTLRRLVACNYSTDNDSLMNVVNMGLKDAVYLLENSGYRVTFKGYGKVVGQEPKAGTVLPKGSVVNLTLKENGDQ